MPSQWGMGWPERTSLSFKTERGRPEIMRWWGPELALERTKAGIQSARCSSDETSSGIREVKGVGDLPA